VAYSWVRALVGSRVLSALVLGLVWWGAGAQAEPPDAPSLPRVEMWSGGEAFQNIFWSVYGGAHVAPFGGVHEDGLRLRGVLGHGNHRSGAVGFADVLVGYHKQVGPVTLKLLAGMTVVDHHPSTPLAAMEGTSFGAKGILEAWWNITDRAWASADLSRASLHMEYASRVRLGWRVWPELSLGLEGGAAGASVPTWERDIARVGGFLRYEWAGGEVSISGGVAVDGAKGEWDGRPEPFGTVAVLTRF
jgi:hypothetical protein